MSLRSAIVEGDVSLLPGKRQEDWRWTDIKGLLRSLPDAAPKVDLSAISTGPFEGLAGTIHVLAAGQPSHLIEVPDGETRVIALRIVTQRAGVFLGSVDIKVGQDASLVLLESYEGPDVQSVSQVDLGFDLGPGARLERVVLADAGVAAILVSKARITLGAGSELAQTLVSCGGRRQRLETLVSHPGAQARAQLDGAYVLDGQSHCDLTSEVRHEGCGGTTTQLTKGVVRGQSRAVFQGRIVVEPGADQTDARMGHHALILSDRAEVNAKPELLIFADDVQCAHGNTVGALDDEVLFYMRQRGLDEHQARALLTEAFVGEVIDRVDFEPAREVLRAWVSARLGT